MTLEDAKKLQLLSMRHEIVEKVLNNWKSDSSLSMTIMCSGNSVDIKKDIGIDYKNPGVGDEELAQDIEAALENQLLRLEQEINMY